MEYLEQIKAKFEGMPLYELLIMSGLGLALMLFGYRIKKIAFFIIWFLIGYNLMMFLMPMLNNMVPEIAGSELYQILLPIAGGLLLALLGFSIEKVCVAGICFFLVMMITVQYFGTEIPTLAIGAIIGVVAGAAANMMMKPAIIIATALAGAYALTVALLNIFPVLDSGILYFPLIGAFTLLGSIFQFVTTKHVS